MSLQPLEDRIIVKPGEAEETTVSGLVIPDTAPGSYQVVAWCLDAGQLAADPVVLSYTVLAAGAAPVAAEPEFTG